jgi:hypothetical protein
MTPPRDDDDRERPSWREIDAKKDRPGQRPRREPRAPKKQAERVRQQALAQAEALFKGKRARPEYQKALRELEEHHGSRKFAGAAKKFLEEYGLPEEWGALLRLLDYPEADAVVQALSALAALAPARSRVEQQGFKGRVQILALTSPHREVRRQAEDILAGL